MTDKPLLRSYDPSPRMAVVFHKAARSAEAAAGLREPGNRPFIIDSDRVLGLPCLLVEQAKKHTDDEFGWSALWILRCGGHRLHAQDRMRLPRQRDDLQLYAGALVLLDTRKPHWTEKGKGVLVAGSYDFEEEPSQADVWLAIEQSMGSELS